jgi:GNAT superfamily N-acetyltransferase
MQHFVFDPADLAPGDSRSRDFDFNRIEVHRISSRNDPLFTEAYSALWEQFGPANELESPDVLERRLAWPSGRVHSGCALRYDLLLLKGEGKFIGVRDHTAIADDQSVTVHLSHVLVAPAFRRTGLAGWLRALPLQTARTCLHDAGLSPTLPITLAAEMEYSDASDPSRHVRLAAYERAGFRKADPSVIRYHQPDFRAARVIDQTGGPIPIPFQLILRRVGREADDSVDAGEVQHIVAQLYHIYGREFREKDMATMWQQLESYPVAGTRIPLILPTA